GLKQPVMMLYDESSRAARQTLAVAVNLAQVNEGSLIVFILADESDTAYRLEREIADWLRGQKLQVHYHRLTGLDLSSLAHILRMKGGGMLVLDGESPLLSEATIQELLDEIDYPVLLIRW
ncbi:MAG: hypothetical protein MN733_05380, partial [Nitrososphaera sp.]|nr:hypothetical protein [Nitrososphaera sp.]